MCESGFHACKNPLDSMKYYSPNDGCVYHEVEAGGDIEECDKDSKLAATELVVGATLSIADMVRGAVG